MAHITCKAKGNLTDKTKTTNPGWGLQVIIELKSRIKGNQKLMLQVFENGKSE